MTVEEQEFLLGGGSIEREVTLMCRIDRNPDGYLITSDAATGSTITFAALHPDEQRGIQKQFAEYDRELTTEHENN